MCSTARSRAESLGMDAKVGMLQRPERVVLLSAPQALFGLTLNGWVLLVIISILTLTAWITVVQRIAYVYGKTRPQSASDDDAESTTYRLWDRPSRRGTTARAALKGE
jgi:hypothetical protein